MYYRIKDILRQKNKSFYWLSMQTGIKEQTFSMMKNRNTKLSSTNLAKVAKALDVSMECLVL